MKTRDTRALNYIPCMSVSICLSYSTLSEGYNSNVSLWPVICKTYTFMFISYTSNISLDLVVQPTVSILMN